MTVAGGPGGGPDPISVVVAGWYPASDEVAAGRFVADQVTALAATGRIQPSMVAWENVPVHGDDALREAGEAVLQRHLATAIGTSPDVFSPEGAHGSPAVPTARLAIGVGEVSSLGPLHLLRHREASILQLADRPEAGRWQLVHGHTGYPEGAAAAALARRLGVPFILTEHATFVAKQIAEPAVRNAYAATLATASRVVAVSRMLADELAAAFPEHAHRLVVVPNTVAVDGFRVTGPADRRPAELLWVGYRKEIKGIDVLLAAFARVHEVRPDATLRLVGRSPSDAEEARWVGLARELGIADTVSFEPQSDRSGIADAMARAALFVHASRRETFGMVAAEALASGLPVVATDSGGVTEVLGDRPQELGALVPAADPAALAAAILATLDRRLTLDPWALRRYVEERYGAASVARRILALYDEVLAEPPRPGTSDLPVAVGPAAKRTDAPSGAMAAPRAIVVVATERRLLDTALRAHPEWVTDGAWLVTTGSPDAARPLLAVAGGITAADVVDLARWGYTAPSGALAGILRRVWAPLRRVRRSLRRRTRERRVLDGMRAAVDRVLARLPAEQRPPLAICLSSIDHLAIEPFVAEGRVVAAPGALRWLGDQRWSGGAGRDRASGLEV